MRLVTGVDVALGAKVRSLEECALLSRLRERTLEVCLLCSGLGACAMCVPSILGGASALVASLAVVVLAGIPLGIYARALFGAAGFAAVSLVPMSVSVQLGVPHVAFDPAGFWTGIAAGVRALGTLSATLLLASATPFHRVVALLRRAGVPTLVLDLLSLVHREIFLLDDTFARLRNSLSARGGWSGARSSFRSVALASALLLPLSLARAARLEEGLRSRGSLDGDVIHLDAPRSISMAGIVLAVLVPIAATGFALWGGRRLGF